MNILLLGSGGREHAMAWKIAQSSKVDKLFISPGNAGTSTVGINIPIAVTDFEGIKNIVLDNNIDMVVVGPEVPLVEGIHDFFLADSALKNIAVVGPCSLGAQLEGSKEFAKAFMERHNIPTAAYRSFTADTINEAFDFLTTLQPPYVLKADGLAAGKGVVILDNIDEARHELKEIFSGKFGSAGNKVVIEEFLSGIELSVFVITDGTSYKLLPEAKDYKRIGEGDTGLNTGGMGSVSPVPFADKIFMDKVTTRIIEPTIKGLQADKIPYKGFIFFGLINVKGDPFVIEYNVRMGDPETEAVMPRISSDFVELLEGVANSNLDEKSIEITSNFATTVMMVSGGYPEDYEKGKVIKGLDSVNSEECVVFHAGTIQKDNEVISAGGRVLSVSGWGETLQEALEGSYRNLKQIEFDKSYYRNDIGREWK